MNLINTGISRDKITKPNDCFICSVKSKRIVAHHENYAKPLDVVWLCDKCHKRRHIYLESIDWVDFVSPIEDMQYTNEVQPDYTKETAIALNGILNTANFIPREMRVIALRARGYTLKQVGLSMELTQERIRQILRKAELKYNRFKKREINKDFYLANAS